MLVLLGILAYGGWYGLTALADSPEFDLWAEAEPSVECTTPEPETARRKRTIVSVYNAGAPTGRGGRLMDALTARGFQEGAVDNAPDGMRVRGVVVWSDDPQSASTQLVLRQLRRARVEERASSPGPGVNIFIGREFTGLRKGPRKVTVQPEPSC